MFCTCIDGSQRMNPTDFGDTLTLRLVPPVGQTFHSSSEILQQLLDGLGTINVCTTFCAILMIWLIP